MAKKKRKIRATFRKNRETRVRESDFTQRFAQDEEQTENVHQSERISGKGDLTRKRTVVAGDDDGDEFNLQIDETGCLKGRVLSVRGLHSTVHADDGRRFECATRRLLKTLETDMRHVVATGDRVVFRPIDDNSGIILKTEPRHGTISRTSRGRQHVIVTNVDLFVIVTSAAEPYLKPHLIDRFLVTAEKVGIAPLICINKIDLIDPAALQPLVGAFRQIGYETLLTSTVTGQGIPRLRQRLHGMESAVVGQSGVGKSSLLNRIDSDLDIRVRSVSVDSQKGRHTTTNATLWPLEGGGYLVDTPGIRQFELWDVIPEEIAGFFPDLRPFVSACRYADCTHTHEEECAVKDAVADDLLNARRYESYCHMFAGDAI